MVFPLTEGNLILFMDHSDIFIVHYSRAGIVFLWSDPNGELQCLCFISDWFFNCGCLASFLSCDFEGSIEFELNSLIRFKLSSPVRNS